MRISDNHALRLARMNPAAVAQALAGALDIGAAALVEDAKASLDEGAIRGRGHIPSAPGATPNSDTGQLFDSGFTVPAAEIGDTIRAAAGFDTPYALALELGTSRMAERPFVRPATERARPEVLRELAASYNTLARGDG